MAGVAGSLLASKAVFAQGCAMCANNASAIRAAAVRSLESGILILLVPVVLIVAGIAVLIFRSRNRFYGARSESEGGWEDDLSPASPLPPDLLREAHLEVHQESETGVGALV